MKKILWTIQDKAAFEVFQKTGVLRADPNHLIFDGEFQDAYDWMVAQMHQRIGPAPARVQYPVWAWYQWEGKRKRMDLRRSGYAKRGTPLVQITFEADPQEFLLSDFDAWHFVQSEEYLADSESDWNDFYANDGDQRKDEIIASWDKIFDMDHDVLNWDSKPTYRSIQATLWKSACRRLSKLSISLRSNSSPGSAEEPGLDHIFDHRQNSNTRKQRGGEFRKARTFGVNTAMRIQKG